MSEDKKCNGWTNYETWATNLWLDGDEYITELAQKSWDDAKADKYFTRLERATLDLADSLKDYIEELQDMEEHKPASLFADLLNSAMQEIDYHDLAESYMSDIDQTEEKTTEEE